MAINSTTSSTTATASSSKGLSGLVSGMDTEALVEKLTLSSKNKIFKEQQKSQKLQWKQDAYRDVTASLAAFKKSYFDSLSATNFKSPSFFNAFKASSSSDAVKVSASSAAMPGNITINKITQLANGQTLSSGSPISKALIGSGDKLTDSEAGIQALAASLIGKSISVNLDGKVRTISFDQVFADAVTSGKGTDETWADSFMDEVQGLLDQSFGKSSSGISLIRADISGNNLSLNSSSGKISLAGEADTLLKLGFESGQSNKISTSSTLKNLSLSTPLVGTSFAFSINSVAFSFSEEDSLSKVISTINSSSAGVILSYSSATDKLTMTAKELGSGDNINIVETSGNFTAALLNQATAGKNAELTVNGVPISKNSNTFLLDGTSFELLKTTATGADPITVAITENSSTLFDPIVKFVNDYNTLIDKINNLIKERPLTDYQPLSDEQKAKMTADQVKEWEKKAKTGILTSDPTLNSIAGKLRSMIYAPGVEGGIALYNIGITSAGLQQNGKLQIDEAVLKEALLTKGSDVKDLFSATSGIAAKMDTIITSAVETKGPQGSRGTLIEIAGITLHSSDTENYITKSIALSAKTLVQLNTRLKSEEARYWSQFTAMESAISRLNTQSAMLTQQYSSSG